MTTVKANPHMVREWADLKACFMGCRHQEDEPHVLPKGTFWPSPRWLFHYEDTHGLPHDMVAQWIWNSVYGVDLMTGRQAKPD